jgi:hypothetical protein
MTSTSSIGKFPKIGFAKLTRVALLSCCILLAAPSLASASTTSTSPWAPILKGLTKSETAPFSAVYQLVETTSGATTENESVTFAQDPAKKEVAVITPQGSFYLSATKTLACRSAGGHVECTSLPASLLSSLSSIKDLFAPGEIESAVGTLQAEASAHGYKLSSYSQSFGWKAPGASGSQYSSECIKVSGPKIDGTGVYCASNSYGVLTYSQGSPSSTKTDTITIHAGGYNSNPPASTFVPPPGATVVTIPSLP